MAERRPPGFNVDLGFYDSDEVLSIPRKIRAAAVGVWTLCGSFSANKLSDGYVSAAALRDRGCTDAIRTALMSTTRADGTPSPLWVDAGDGAVQFTRWPKWQRTAAEIKAYREGEAERKRKAREAKKRRSRGDVCATCGLLHADVDVTCGSREAHVADQTNATSSPHEDTRTSSTSRNPNMSGRTSAGHAQVVQPEDGDPKTETETETEISTSVVALVGGSGGKGSRLPDGWMPPTDVVAQMRSDHPQVDLKAEHAKFTDYWRGKAGKDARKADWTATWRNWIRRAAEQAPRNGHGPPRSTADLRVAQAQALKSTPSQRLELE